MGNPTIRSFPPVEDDRVRLSAPIVTVTLLEDRAMVRREGRAALAKGLNRLLVADVAPVLQDVSVRGEIVSGGARVADTRVRRAQRALRDEKPEALQAIEKEGDAIAREFEDAGRARRLAARRYAGFQEMLEKALSEIPEDASWGQVYPNGWRETLSPLFARAREEMASILDRFHAQQDAAERMEKLSERHEALARPDWNFTAWIELDVFSEEGGEAAIAVDYVVPNALWRPLHTARLEKGETLAFDVAASVWQRTGEDWNGVDLVFSTARASLGIEPPLLADDLLETRRRSEQVVVAAREVAIQKAGVAPAAPQPAAVDLPGVDDGGETRNLRAKAKATLPSDGRPHVVPILRFESKARVERLCMPEIAPCVFVRSTQEHTGRQPVLAGPVALQRDHGHVGWTKTLFVAPGETFELGFGPDEDLRVSRRTRAKTEEDPVDHWRHTTHTVEIFLSNLGDTPRKARVLERIPVSEIAEVRASVLAEKSTGKPAADENGFVSWDVDLPAYGRKTLMLVWKLSVAPGVAGL